MKIFFGRSSSTRRANHFSMAGGTLIGTKEPFPGAKVAFKPYEMKLLAALAQCYRGKKTFADLP